MKKLLTIISFVLNIILAGTLLYFAGDVLNKNLQNAEEKKAVYRIAVMQPAIHPSMDEITKGFLETIESKMPGRCENTIFNANNSAILMRSQLEEIVHQEFDILMTIGSKATQLAKEVAQKKRSSMPIIFTAVADAVEKNIVASLQSSGNQLTGVIEEVNFEEMVDALFLVTKNIKNVLLVHNPSQAGLVKEADALEKVFKEKGLQMLRAEVFQSNEIYQKLSGLLAGIDVVLILKDHTTVSAVESIAKLCSARNITFMASDLDSPARGAALGFGVFEKQFGVQGAYKALQILHEKKHPSQIPCTAVEGAKLRINPHVCAKQRLPFSEDQIKLFRLVDVL